jgi:CheY-like chemotaxis protein
MFAKPDNGKKRLLLVEDNPGDVEILRYALVSAKVNCDMTVIDNGSDALAFIQQRGKYLNSAAPDLAILDLNLPRHDGIEILEAIRSNRQFDGVPIVVLSSSSSPRDLAKLQAFRIGRYITKPPDLEEYIRIGLVVKELLEESQTKA